MVSVGSRPGGVKWSLPVPLLEVTSGQLSIAIAHSYIHFPWDVV